MNRNSSVFESRLCLVLAAGFFIVATAQAQTLPTQVDLEKQVQAEQWTDAAKTVDVLLKDKPDDATLKGYKEEITKHLAPASSPAVASAAPLSDDDKLEWDTLTLIVNDAMGQQNAEDRKKAMVEYLDKSLPFITKHPDFIKAWQFRAVAALELDRAKEGSEAGLKLKALGALHSEDTAMRSLMANLNRKGWLDAEKMARLKAAGDKFAAMKGKNIKVPLGTGVELELVWVPAGYWVGKYEVTQAEYTAVIGSNPAMFRGERRPVEQVSWNDAMEFCKKVTEQARSAGWLPLDWQVTLPTEKQWEYFVADATLTDAVTNRWNDNISEVSQQPGTLPVGSKGANRLGLYDVRGNAWEWCADWYDSEQKTKVLRGGSWDRYNAEGLAVSSRYRGTPDGCGSSYGFRVVLVPTTTK